MRLRSAAVLANHAYVTYVRLQTKEAKRGIVGRSAVSRDRTFSQTRDHDPPRVHCQCPRLPEHLHRAHSIIIDMQPSTSISIRVKNFDRMVPAARSLTTVVKHPIARFLILASVPWTKKENRTGWFFELRREPNRLSYFTYAIRSRVVQGPLKVEDENGWKCLEKHLLAELARLARAELVYLYRLRL